MKRAIWIQFWEQGIRWTVINVATGESVDGEFDWRNGE